MARMLPNVQKLLSKVTDEVAHVQQGKKELTFHALSVAGKLLCLSERETSPDRLRSDGPSAWRICMRLLKSFER